MAADPVSDLRERLERLERLHGTGAGEVQIEIGARLQGIEKAVAQLGVTVAKLEDTVTEMRRVRALASRGRDTVPDKKDPGE